MKNRQKTKQMKSKTNEEQRKFTRPQLSGFNGLISVDPADKYKWNILT